MPYDRPEVQPAIDRLEAVLAELAAALPAALTELRWLYEKPQPEGPSLANPDEVVTLKEAAALLKTSTMTLNRLRTGGALQGFTIGNRRYFRVAELLAVMEHNAGDQVMTLSEAAEYTRYSIGAVRAAAAAGRLKTTQMEAHGQRRTTRADCDAWLQSGRIGPPRRKRTP